MKLTNTWKHAIGGALLGYIAIPVSFYPQLAVFVAIGVLMCLVAWENAQYQRAKKAWQKACIDNINNMLENQQSNVKPYTKADLPKYKHNWLDTIVDVLSAFATFNIGYWLILAVAK